MPRPVSVPSGYLETALRWHVRLQGGAADEQQRQAWRAWVEAAPEHAKAWARVEQMQDQLHGMPAELALPMLARAGLERRTAIKSLLVFAALGLAGAGYEFSPLSADYASATGQRRQVVLPDGTRLDLNTDTQVDVYYCSAERLITLRHGEIRVQSAPDNQTQAPRPLVIKTRHGRIQALGTAFNVRLNERQTRVSVQKQAVLVSNVHGSQRLNSGEELSFDAHHLGAVEPADANRVAWTSGLLVANDWRLGDFVDELARYRVGRLTCSPDVADLRITGTFAPEDSDTVLAALVVALPVRVRRLSRYWVRVEA